MKRFSLLFCTLLVVFAFVIPSFAFAKSHEDKIILVGKDEVINHDYFAGGDTVTVLGTINGDAYVGGGNVTFDGTVNGDIIAAGGNVVIRGNVQNVRVAGGQVTISGNVEKNVTALGGNITLTDTATVSGSVVAGGGTITLDSPIGQGATLGGGTITIEDTVNGDVTAASGQLILHPDARVNGNLLYTSDEQAEIMPGASISGKLAHTIPQKNTNQEENAKEFFSMGLIAAKLMEAVSLLVIGLLLVLLAPRYVARIADGIAEKPWKSLGVGLLALIVVPVVVVLLMATIIGIPLAIILGVLFAITMYASKLFVIYLIGAKISVTFSKKIHPVLILMVGLLIYEVVSLLPIIGSIMDFAVLLAGIGGLLLQKKEMYMSLRKQKKL